MDRFTFEEDEPKNHDEASSADTFWYLLDNGVSIARFEASHATITMLDKALNHHAAVVAGGKLGGRPKRDKT